MSTNASNLKKFWVVFFKDSNGRMTQTMFEHNPTADFKNMYNYCGTKLIEIDMSDL